MQNRWHDRKWTKNPIESDYIKGMKKQLQIFKIIIRQAIDHCIEDVLRDFQNEHWEAVMHVMTLDYTFERRMEMQQ